MTAARAKWGPIEIREGRAGARLRRDCAPGVLRNRAQTGACWPNRSAPNTRRPEWPAPPGGLSILHTCCWPGERLNGPQGSAVKGQGGGGRKAGGIIYTKARRQKQWPACATRAWRRMDLTPLSRRPGQGRAPFDRCSQIETGCELPLSFSHRIASARAGRVQSFERTEIGRNNQLIEPPERLNHGFVPSNWNFRTCDRTN